MSLHPINKEKRSKIRGSSRWGDSEGKREINVAIYVHIGWYDHQEVMEGLGIHWARTGYYDDKLRDLR